MAVEYTIYCDGCGGVIDASSKGVRDARATAQLQCGAVSSGGKDWCRACRLERTRLSPGHALAGAPSVGTRR